MGLDAFHLPYRNLLTEDYCLKHVVRVAMHAKTPCMTPITPSRTPLPPPHGFVHNSLPTLLGLLDGARWASRRSSSVKG